MRLKPIVYAVVSLLFFNCNAQNKIGDLTKTYKVNSLEVCEKKAGYWYKNKCWANFDESEGISIANIDNEVKRQMEIIDNTKMVIDGEAYPINFFFPEEDGEQIILITMFKKGAKTQTLLQFVDTNALPIYTEQSKTDKQKTVETSAILIDADIIALDDNDKASANLFNNPLATGTLTATVNDLDTLDISFKGQLKYAKDATVETIAFKSNEAITGAGNSTIEVKENKAFLNGTLGTVTYPQIKNLTLNHPEVKTLVLQNVPGSINDAVNMHTGRLIREAGLNTMVLVNSKISSGGVDLFCAGNERIVTKGAQLGIHSWGGEGISADELPKDHPAHQYQIEYFTMCLGEKLGPDFYFRTLSAAPAGDMYWMKNDEIKEKVATKFIIK